jgi:hypothetical protein
MAILLRPNPEAFNFLDAAGIARTEANSSIIIATCQLTTDLKNYGLWNKMKVIYPFVGQVGVSSSFQYNLKDPTSYTGLFTGSWTFASTGVTPNSATTTYMDTYYNPAINSQATNTSIFSYNRTGTFIAAQFGGRGLEIFDYTGNRYPLNGTQLDCGPLWTGWTLSSRTSSTLMKVYNNNTSTFSSTGSITNPFLSSSVKVGSIGFTGANGQACFFGIGEGFNDTEATNLYTAVQRFQTTLGRQV